MAAINITLRHVSSGEKEQDDKPDENYILTIPMTCEKKLSILQLLELQNPKAKDDLRRICGIDLLLLMDKNGDMARFHYNGWFDLPSVRFGADQMVFEHNPHVAVSKYSVLICVTSPLPPAPDDNKWATGVNVYEYTPWHLT